MRNSRYSPGLPTLAALAALVLSLALVWAFVLRESASLGVELEYEIYRNASAMLENAWQDPESATADPDVMGFGMYDALGEATFRDGRAPERLGAGDLPQGAYRLSIGVDSAVLVRALGAEASRSGMMRPMMGRGRLQTPGSPGDLWTPLAGASRYVWIEYALGAFRTERAALFGGAGLLTLALGAGAALVARLAARNRELAARAARDRELVQLGEAARTLAHEIKNPLGVIRVQSALVRKRMKEGTAAAADGLAIIDEETARLSDLADRIGAFLRGDEGAPETFAIGPFLADFSRRYGASCERAPALATLEGSVRTDPERLRGILDNLVANALDAAEEAGAGRVFSLEASSRKQRVELRIGDRGKGIPPALSERVFEPFFTTKARGSGIGLALARRQTDSAGGDLRHEAREGGGTWFIVSLPRVRAEDAERDAPPAGDED